MKLEERSKPRPKNSIYKQGICLYILFYFTMIQVILILIEIAFELVRA